MKRKLISVSLALALGLSLAACGSKPAPSGAETPAGELGTLSGPVELQFWHSISNQNHLKVLEGLVEEFNETIGAEKGITVVPTFNGSSSELYSSVVGAIKAGSAPDVTLALRPYVADYLQTDYVVNLEPYITDPNVGMTDYEDIFEGLREANSSYAKEGIYSLPIHSYSEVLYYNKTFFAEHGLSVPTTWDELVETCRAIRDITGAPAFGWDNLAGSFMTLLLQNGGRYTDQNGNLYFATEDSDITLKVLQMWQDNVNEGIWRTAGEDQFFSGPFANEMIPMYIGDSVEASYIPDKNPELDWGTAPVPQVSEDTAANLSAGHVIIALNQDGNQDRMYAAYEFIKFMTSHDANLAVAAGNTGYLPIRQSVAEDPDMAAMAAAFQPLVEEQYLSQFGVGFDEVLARSPFAFTPIGRFGAEHREDTLGSLIADSYVYAVQQAEGADYVPVDFAVVAAGVIRGSFPAGEITTSDVFNVSSLGSGADGTPGYPLISVWLTGKELKDAFEVDASVTALMPEAQIYGAGMTWTWNPHRMMFNKVTDCAQVLPDGSAVPIDDDRLYRVVTGLYTGQMLGTVNDQSFGILAITPKDAQGNVITDYEEHIIYNPNGSEVKEWYALASYLQSMGEVDGRYAAPEGRKVEHATWNPLNLLKNLNLFGWLAVLAAVLVLAAVVFLVWRLCFHHRRGRYGGRRRGGGYRPYRG